MSDIHLDNLEGRDESSSCSTSEAKISLASLGSAAYPECQLKYAWIFNMRYPGDSAKLETLKNLPKGTTCDPDRDH